MTKPVLSARARKIMHLKHQPSYANPPLPNAAGPRVITAVSVKGTYSAKELMPFDGRPGAMDAFKIPSRRSP
jgi:hypothetical protein